MGWERRGAAGAYYYRSYRDAEGRAVKEYLGRGAKADAAARDVAGREAERAADGLAVGQEVSGLARLDRLAAELDGGAALLLEAHLLANGFHRANYGPWRKSREQGRRAEARGRR